MMSCRSAASGDVLYRSLVANNELFNRRVWSLVRVTEKPPPKPVVCRRSRFSSSFCSTDSVRPADHLPLKSRSARPITLLRLVLLALSSWKRK